MGIFFLVGLGIVLMFLFLYVVSDNQMAAAMKRREAEEARLRALGMAEIDAMDGWAFEAFTAKLLINEGFSDVRVTKGSGDNGVDITASKDQNRYAIQCKRYSSPVSRRAVSDSVGGLQAYNCNVAMVITNNVLSKKAREFAQKSGCAVIERPILLEWIERFQKGESGSGLSVPKQEKPFIADTTELSWASQLPDYEPEAVDIQALVRDAVKRTAPSRYRK
jgi:restriction system protein